MSRPCIIVLCGLLGCGHDKGSPFLLDGGSAENPDGGLTTTPLPVGSSGDAGVSSGRDARASTGGRDAATAPVTTPAQGAYFPAGAWMYQRADALAVDKDSATITQWLATNGGFGTGQIRIDFSIDVLTADAATPRHSFSHTDDFYSPDCDSLPFPVPTQGALEGEDGYACTQDGDCHLLVVDRAAARLYEMWRANITGNTFAGGCAVLWDMNRVYGPEGRGEQCTSADAAGFPIAPLLFSADEVAAGSIDHAIRFILPNERMRAKTYQHPGTHAGGPSGPVDAPIYGSRWRLKADFDLSKLPSAGARVVARALQQYGMALADGGNIALTAQNDRFTAHKWEGLLDTRDLASLKPTDFEVVQTGEPIALNYDCTRTPITN